MYKQRLWWLLNGVSLRAILASLIFVGFMPTTQAASTHNRAPHDLWSTSIAALESVRTLISCATDPWVVEAAHESLDPMLVYSMALTESRMQWSDGWIRPCPYCLRVGPTAYRPDTKAEAVALLRDGVARGERITDVGVMQINADVHRDRVDGDLERFLDMRTNIRVGAQILAEALSSSTDFATGLGRYHSWTPRLGKPYGDVAARRYRSLIQATPQGTLWPQCTAYAQLN